MQAIPFEVVVEAAKLIGIAMLVTAGLLVLESWHDTKPRNPWDRRK